MMKLRYAMVCASNQNRSMEAHALLQKRGFDVSSYGTGAHVKLPGPSIREPNIYKFGTPYRTMFEDLKRKDSELYPFTCEHGHHCCGTLKGCGYKEVMRVIVKYVLFYHSVYIFMLLRHSIYTLTYYIVFGQFSVIKYSHMVHLWSVRFVKLSGWGMEYNHEVSGSNCVWFIVMCPFLYYLLFVIRTFLNEDACSHVCYSWSIV